MAGTRFTYTVAREKAWRALHNERYSVRPSGDDPHKWYVYRNTLTGEMPCSCKVDRYGWYVPGCCAHRDEVAGFVESSAS